MRAKGHRTGRDVYVQMVHACMTYLHVSGFLGVAVMPARKSWSGISVMATVSGVDPATGIAAMPSSCGRGTVLILSVRHGWFNEWQTSHACACFFINRRCVLFFRIPQLFGVCSWLHPSLLVSGWIPQSGPAQAKPVLGYVATCGLTTLRLSNSSLVCRFLISSPLRLLFQASLLC